MRLYTKNQLPRLSGSGLKFCGGVVGYTPIAVSHQLRFWLKLGCDNYFFLLGCEQESTMFYVGSAF
jgi:hypothetical protein